MISFIQKQLLRRPPSYTTTGLFQGQIGRMLFSAKVDFSKDYYQILQIDQNANPADIKKQYYKLVKEFHPDLNKDNEEIFKKINEAYEILSNEATRNEYNVGRFNPFTGAASNPTGSHSSSGSTQQSYGRYYSNYGNQRRARPEDFKRYEQAYHSQADINREQSGDYNQRFRQSQFYSEFKGFNENEFESQYSAEEKMRQTKLKIITFSAAAILFYFIFDVLLYRVMNSSDQYTVYDPQTGQSFVTDAATFEQLKRRNYDPSFIAQNDRDLYRRHQASAMKDEAQFNFRYNKQNERL